MAGRLPSTSYYQVIPQAPVASNTITPALDIDFEEEDETPLTELPLSSEVSGGIRWVHFILGCAVLLPWNALITATPYFLSRLQGSPLRSTFSSYLSLTFTATNFGFLAHATATSKQASLSRRVSFGILIIACLCAVLTLTTYLQPPPGVFFVFIMVTGIIMAGTGSYLQSAVIAVASLFGPTAIQAVMSGYGAVGAVVSAIQVLSAAAAVRKASTPLIRSDEEDEAEAKSAFMFFGISTMFLLCSVGAHAWLMKTPAYGMLVSPLERSISRRRSSTDESQGLVSGLSNAANKGDVARIWRVAKANAMFYFVGTYIFVVTLAVFPPITISILPTSSTVHPLVFSAFHFLVFNIGDFSGRGICSWPRVLIWSPKKLLTLSLARTLFIPLFLLCNIQRPSSFSPLSSDPPISSDILYLLILYMFGFSNGYLASLMMMAVPSVEHNPKLEGRREDVDVAATLGSFCIVAGLAIGSLTSFAVRAAVCQCNPFT